MQSTHWFALATGLWFGLSQASALSAQTSIYHDGWIDHNKNGRKDPFEDPALDIEARIADLLKQMTLEEKAGQMTTLYGFGNVLMDELPTPAWRDSSWRHGIANIDEHLSGRDAAEKYRTKYSWPPSAHARALNEVQRWFIEQTRLGIPVDFTMEGIRGIGHDKATSFPSQIGVASTFDLDLISQIGHVTGREARALGYTNVYSPILDLARDPRWGRTVETYTEDPWLAARYGVAQIKGLQAEGVAATPKHFAVHGIPVGGRDGPVRKNPGASWREVMELHLEPFRAAFMEAGALGTMVTYADYDGIPIGGSKLFLTDILRDQYGFTGYTVSDSGVQERMHSSFFTSPTFSDAVRETTEAGLDVWTAFLSPATFIVPLIQLVRDSKLAESTIDARVRNVLRVKFKLGLFDKPYIEHPEASDSIVHNDANRQLSLRAARESIVLLKNADNVLPLNRDLRSILVVGPNADEDYGLQSRYGPQHMDAITVLEGIKAAVPSSTRVTYLKGVNITDARFPESDIVREAPPDSVQQSINAAAQAARSADIAIVVVGETREVVGESHSRVSLNLPGYQEDLLRAIHATGTRTIVVLLNGRPLSINWADQHVPAILEAWFPGEFAGRAIADVLFGDYNPSGRLPVTFPKSVGQIPLTFPHKVSTEGREPTRVAGPLYPFGYGLSFTTFKYDSLRINPAIQQPDGRIDISLSVANIGARAGDEVVQLYVRDVYASVSPYEKLLRGITRVSLAPGERQRISFTLGPQDLRMLDRDMKWVVEPGAFEVMLGSSSEDVRVQGRFEIARPAPQRRAAEWSQALVESTMKRNPDVWAGNGRLPWSYPIGFFQYAHTRVYRRTQDARMLTFLRAWADSVVQPSGQLRIEERRLANLDAMQPALALTMIYNETHDERYRTGATQARRRYDNYPRTADGGFWHRNPQTPGELWADGLFMAPVLLARYGQVLQDTAALNEAARQFDAYIPHLRDPRTGLLFHAWDEDGNAKWADPTTHRSPIIWGRAIGWTAMGLVEVLDALPANHPARKNLLAHLRALVDALARAQDVQTGLWWQIVDQGGREGNWTEASSTAMYTYAIARAVNRGYVSSKYAKHAERGYAGALTKVSIDEDGLVSVRDICEGTNVSDTYEYYAARRRNANDLHGLAAYLLMFEEMGAGKFRR